MNEDFTKQLYQFVGESATKITNNTESMKTFAGFLGMYQGRNHTIRNKLLIAGYNINATDVRTAEEWSQVGVSIPDLENCIWLMKKDSSASTGYTAQAAYDRSATSLGAASEPYIDPGELAERILLHRPCPVVFVQDGTLGRSKALYVEGDNKIQVRAGYNNLTDVCHLMIQEYTHVAIREEEKAAWRPDESGRPFQYNRNHARYGSLSQLVTYAVCKRYGIKAPELTNLQPLDTNIEGRIAYIDRINRLADTVTKQIEGREPIQKAERRAAASAASAMPEAGRE